MYPIFAPRTKKENHTNTTVARATTIASAPDSITDNNDSAPDSITDNNDDSTSDIIVIHDWDSDSDKEISIPLAPLLRQMTSDDDKEPVVLLPRTGHAETKQTICDGRDEHHERIAIESKIRTYFLIVVLSVSILSFCSWIYTRIVDSK